VHGSDGGLGLGITGHFNEPKALRPAGVAVHNHLCRFDGAMRFEQSLEIAVVDGVGEVAYVQLLAHKGLPKGIPTWQMQSPADRCCRAVSSRNFGDAKKGEWRWSAVATVQPWPDRLTHLDDCNRHRPSGIEVAYLFSSISGLRR